MVKATFRKLMALVQLMGLCAIGCTGPEQWKQFHADGPNQGFISVRTGPAEEPTWTAQVGRVLFGSPVVGDEGRIYVGTRDGELVAINPSGSIAWRLALSARDDHSVVTGSPAVGNDGNIYVVSTRFSVTIREHDPEVTYNCGNRSTLHSVTPDGDIRWSFPFPHRGLDLGFTTASAKTWGEGRDLVIFLPVHYGPSKSRNYLFAIDQAGDLIAQRRVMEYGGVFGGPGWNPFKWLGDLLDFSFDESGVAWPGCAPPGWADWPDSTVAVVDYRSLSSRPVVVVDDNVRALVAYAWRDSEFVEVWRHVSATRRNHSSPAAFGSGLLAVGQDDGRLLLYDVETGDELWKPWPSLGQAILGSPASLARRIYAVGTPSDTGSRVYVLDDDGEILDEAEITGKAASSPALSNNLAYVSASDGLYTFKFEDLRGVQRYAAVEGGSSSPTIAKDGSIYIVDKRGMLWAFNARSTGELTPIPPADPRLTERFRSHEDSTTNEPHVVETQ